MIPLNTAVQVLCCFVDDVPNDIFITNLPLDSYTTWKESLQYVSMLMGGYELGNSLMFTNILTGWILAILVRLPFPFAGSIGFNLLVAIM